MAAPTKLSLYNGAIRLLGEGRLSSLSESRESRRLLDDIWADGVIDSCLEDASWGFATRTVSLDRSDSVEPEFGFTYAFEKPTDWKRTVKLCSDEYLRYALQPGGYNDHDGYWYADVDPIYVQYVSNDTDWGLDYARWTEKFKDYVHASMALLIAPNLTGGDEQKIKRIEKVKKDCLTAAAGLDAMQKPAQEIQHGQFVRARSGGGSWTRGSRSAR